MWSPATLQTAATGTGRPGTGTAQPGQMGAGPAADLQAAPNANLNIGATAALPPTTSGVIANTGIPSALTAAMPANTPKVRAAPSVFTSSMARKQTDKDQAALAAVNATHAARATLRQLSTY